MFPSSYSDARKLMKQGCDHWLSHVSWNIYILQFTIEVLAQFKATEPPRGKTNNLHRRKQRRSTAVTAKLISAFVFATRIVQFLFYLNPKFQASSSFL